MGSRSDRAPLRPSGEGCTDAAGISEHTYHTGAVVLGTIAGIAALGGPAVLIRRRRTVGPVHLSARASSTEAATHPAGHPRIHRGRERTG